jgi:hypothetical protein
VGIHEQKIEQRINELGCSIAFVSALASLHGITGTSSSRFNSAFQGHSFPAATLERLWPLLDDLRSFTADFYPVPVALKDAATIKPLLDSWRRGELPGLKTAFLRGVTDALRGENQER